MQVEGIDPILNPFPVNVNVVGGGGTGGTSSTDDSVFTPGTTSETPIGGIVDDSAPHVVADGKTGAVRITPYRALHSYIVNALGVALGTLLNPFRVDPTGTTTQPATIKDSTNTSCMDDANQALRVNVVAGGAGGGAVTIANGADIVEGALADAAITTNTAGTISGKLRGLVAILADVWDSANNRLNVEVQNSSIPVTGPLTDTQLRASSVDTTVTNTVTISGSVTANAGTNLNTSALALEAGGNLAGINTNAGATTDAAITTDVNGTISGKLRGLVKILNDVWDSTSHFLKVSIQNATIAVTQSGNWSSRTQDGSGNSITSTSSALDVNVKNSSLAVTGPLTDVQLRASSVDVNVTGGSSTITGTVTANAGTNLNTSALALEAGGNLAGINTNAGSTTDVAVTTDIDATISSKLRGLVKLFNDVWDSTSHFLKVSIQNATLAVTQSGNWSTRTQDGSGNAITSTSSALDVNVKNSSIAVTGPLTDTQLRATAVPVSAASLPLPSGAATEATLSTLNGKVPSQGQAVMASSVPVVIASNQSAVSISGTVTANAGTNLNTSALLTEADFDTKTGSLTETAPATDTASSGLNGRLQRIAQRLTSLIALLPTALTGSGNLKVAVVESTATQTVSGSVTANAGTNLNTSALLTESDFDTKIGSLTETAPATDTASSGLNGRLQRVAQRITSLIALVPAALTASGNFKVAVQEALPAGTNAIGKLAANSGVTIGAVEVAAAQTLATVTTVSTLTGSGVANDAVDSGNPHKIGGYAITAERTGVANADRVDGVFDIYGRQIIAPYTNPENIISGVISTAMTGTTSTSLIGAPGSGLRNYITSVVVSNAHASVGTDILLQDGSGGTTLAVLPAAPGYGGSVITFPVPLRQPTANTALYAQNVTTGASTKVSAFGYKGA